MHLELGSCYFKDYDTDVNEGEKNSAAEAVKFLTCPRHKNLCSTNLCPLPRKHDNVPKDF